MTSLYWTYRNSMIKIFNRFNSTKVAWSRKTEYINNSRTILFILLLIILRGTLILMIILINNNNCLLLFHYNFWSKTFYARCYNLRYRVIHFEGLQYEVCRSQWPRGLRRRSASVHLLRLGVWILPGAWMSVCCECCVFSGRGLCDELITRPEKSYQLWCVVMCNLQTS